MNSDSLEDSHDYYDQSFPSTLMTENIGSISEEIEFSVPIKSPLEIEGEKIVAVFPYLKDPANIEANILVYNYMSLMDQQAFPRNAIEEMSKKYISDIFNLGEPEELYSILKTACSQNIRISVMPHKFTTHSTTALFALLYISQSIYPDAMCKVLERRVYPNNMTFPRSLRVEYIFKFTGTRILSKFLLETYQEFLCKEFLSLNPNDPASKIINTLDTFISRIEVSSNPFLSSAMDIDYDESYDRVSKIIFEAVLTIDVDTRLITNLDIEILASNIPHLQNKN